MDAEAYARILMTIAVCKFQLNDWIVVVAEYSGASIVGFELKKVWTNYNKHYELYCRNGCEGRSTLTELDSKLGACVTVKDRFGNIIDNIILVGSYDYGMYLGDWKLALSRGLFIPDSISITG